MNTRWSAKSCPTRPLDTSPNATLKLFFRIEKLSVGFRAPKGMLRKGLGMVVVSMRELDRALWGYSKVKQDA